MSPTALGEQESAGRRSAATRPEALDQEVVLLIREARRRQRRRRISQTLGAVLIAGVAALAVLGVAGAYSPSRQPASSTRPALQAGGSCPSSSARFVANSIFSATVLGRGAVRLAIGNRYLKRSRRVVLGTTGSPRWSAIEVIWVRYPGHPGTLTIHGSRVGKRGTIDLGSSDGGQSPGSGGLSLAPQSANTAPGGLQLYPGAIWVRSGGCYALNVSGPGLSERIVLDAQAH